MCQKHQLMRAYTSLTQTVYLSHILFISLKSFFFVPPFSFCTDGQIMVLTTISQVKTICRFPPTLYCFCSSHTAIWLSVPSAASISQPLVVTRTSWLESSTKKQKQHLGCFYKQIVGHELSPWVGTAIGNVSALIESRKSVSISRSWWNVKCSVSNVKKLKWLQ